MRFKYSFFLILLGLLLPQSNLYLQAQTSACTSLDVSGVLNAYESFVYPAPYAGVAFYGGERIVLETNLVSGDPLLYFLLADYTAGISNPTIADTNAPSNGRTVLVVPEPAIVSSDYTVWSLTIELHNILEGSVEFRIFCEDGTGSPTNSESGGTEPYVPTDGRLGNASDPVAIYCIAGGVHIYEIDEHSQGYLILEASSAEIAAVDIPFTYQLIEASENGLARLYRLYTGEIQLNYGPTSDGKEFVFVPINCPSE